MSIRVTSGMTKTDVLDAFVTASSKAGETLTITSDIPNVAVASFAVDVLRRMGHSYSKCIRMDETTKIVLHLIFRMVKEFSVATNSIL